VTHLAKKSSKKSSSTSSSTKASEEPPMAEAGTASKTSKGHKSAPVKSAAHLAKDAREAQEAAQKLAKEEAEASPAPSPEASPEPAEAGVESCTAVVGQTAADDAWCIQNCGNVPPNCPAELCSCGGKEVASAQPAGPAVPAVPDVPVPSPGVSNPSLNEAVADRAT